MFVCGDRNVLKLDREEGCTFQVLNVPELFILQWLILHYMNFPQ